MVSPIRILDRLDKASAIIAVLSSGQRRVDAPLIGRTPRA